MPMVAFKTAKLVSKVIYRSNAPIILFLQVKNEINIDTHSSIVLKYKIFSLRLCISLIFRHYPSLINKEK